MYRAGMILLVIACLSACSDLRGPVVLELETERKLENFRYCLETNPAFSSVDYVSGQRRSDPIHDYLINDRHMLTIDNQYSQTKRLVVRSKGGLSSSEKAALVYCAD